MKEISRIDYSKIDDNIMDQIINYLYMLKKTNPEKDVYFNEKSINMIIKSINKIPNLKKEIDS